MILTLDAKRRLTLPATLVPAQPGDHFQAEFDPEEDAVVFRRIPKRADWLSVGTGKGRSGDVLHGSDQSPCALTRWVILGSPPI